MVWTVNDRLAPVQLYLASESPLMSIIEASLQCCIAEDRALQCCIEKHRALQHCMQTVTRRAHTHVLDLGPVQPNIRNTGTRDTWHVAQLTPGQCWSPHTGPRVKMSRTGSIAARLETVSRVWSLEHPLISSNTRLTVENVGQTVLVANFGMRQ